MPVGTGGDVDGGAVILGQGLVDELLAALAARHGPDAHPALLTLVDHHGRPRESDAEAPVKERHVEDPTHGTRHGHAGESPGQGGTVRRFDV